LGLGGSGNDLHAAVAIQVGHGHAPYFRGFTGASGVGRPAAFEVQPAAPFVYKKLVALTADDLHDPVAIQIKHRMGCVDAAAVAGGAVQEIAGSVIDIEGVIGRDDFTGAVPIQIRHKGGGEPTGLTINIAYKYGCLNRRRGGAWHAHRIGFAPGGAGGCGYRILRKRIIRVRTSAAAGQQDAGRQQDENAQNDGRFFV